MPRPHAERRPPHEHDGSLPPLPIFTDASASPLPPCLMVEPLLGRPEPGGDGATARYFSMAPDLFRLTNRAEAAIAVLAWDWDTVHADAGLRRFARTFIRDNARRGLKTLVFRPHDSESPVRTPHVLVFRTSIVKGRHGPHERAMPWFTDGFPATSPADALRPYRSLPSVGFCGALHRNEWRRPTLYRRLFRRHRNQYPLAYPHAPGLRAIALDTLRRTPGIEPRLIERDRFMGGALRPDGTVDAAIARATGREFLDNLVGTDYALCMRGAGNFSIRFYEALSLGRIPLLLDTDCVLPWPDIIDWPRLIVRVDARDMPELGAILRREHARMGEEEFVARQHRCRAAWQRHLGAPGFFATLRRRLETAA